MSDWLIRFDHELINLATGAEITCYPSEHAPQQWVIEQTVGNHSHMLMVGEQEPVQRFFADICERLNPLKVYD